MVQAGRDFRVCVATRRPPLLTPVPAEGVLREAVPLGRVPAWVPPRPPVAPRAGVSSSPWASPDAETLMLTAGVRSHPALGREVALPALGSCLVGSPSLGPVIKPLLVPAEVPHHLLGPPDSWETRREGGLSAWGCTGLELLGTPDTPCPGRGHPKAQRGAHMGAQVEPLQAPGSSSSP